MKCNLIIPGFAKCGTSSLHEYLNLHPRIAMSRNKEPHYFSIDKYYRKEAAYDENFTDAGPDSLYFGDSSTTYSVWEAALARIKKDVRDPKLIVLVREPVERLLSHYRWMYALGLESKPLHKALKEERRSIASPRVHRSGCYPWYRRCSHYSYFIPIMQALFDAERVLLVKSPDLSDNPQAVLDRICDFLGLAGLDIGGQDIRANETSSKRAVRPSRLRRLHRKLPSRIRKSGIIPQSWLESTSSGKKRVAPEPGESLLADISGQLAEDVKFYQSIPSVQA